MKRILAFVLLLIICAMTFTACQLPDELQSVIDKIIGNEPTVDVVYDLDGAVKYLVETQYASWKKDNSTPSDVLLVPQVIVKRVSYKVTWTCESDILTITPNADGSSTIKMPRLAEEHNYSLIATVEDGNGNKETHQFDLVVPANLAGDAVQPVVGTGYYLQIEQNAAKKVLFFNGKPESESKTYRLAMTTNPSSAALVYVEAVEGVDGAYRLYFMNGDVKTYLVVKEYTDDDAAPGAGKGTLTWETETPAEYYTYDANAKTFIHTDADGEDSYYMGTYSTYETISVSNASYITGDSANKVDASQFPVRFVTPESVPSHTCKYVDEVTAPTCTADGYTTHTCSICGDSYTDSETTKLGHNFVDKVCTNCGETEHTCADANGDFVCDVTDCDKQVLPEAGATLTIEQALKLGALFTKDTYTSGKYYVTGVIDKITQETYGNMVLKDDKGNTLTIYGTYDATGEKKYGEMTGTKPVVGDTITVYGIIGYYSAPQLKNGWITAINPAEGGETPDQPGEGGGETPEQPGEGGGETPEQPGEGGGETPSTPTSGLVAGKGYKVTANNKNGALWLKGTITSGRFDCSTSEADAVVVYVEETTGGYLLYMLVNGTKTYICMDDKAAGGKTVTDAASATVYEWNADLNTLVVAEDTNNRAFGAGQTSDYNNFSAYDSSQTGYNWGAFVAVDGSNVPSTPEQPGEGGGETPEQPGEGGGETPSTPTSGLVAGKGYKVTANNKNGALWLKGTITSGRFDCSTSEADAVVVYVEETTGGYLLYMLVNGTKTYICMDDKAAGGKTVTDAASATVYEWNADLNTLVVAEDTNNRAFGAGQTSDYNNFSAYDSSQTGYNWGAFVAVE